MYNMYHSATGTAELLNHEQEEVDRILANVRPLPTVHAHVHVHGAV